MGLLFSKCQLYLNYSAAIHGLLFRNENYTKQKFGRFEICKKQLLTEGKSSSFLGHKKRIAVKLCPMSKMHMQGGVSL